jgi:hypothetical protein
LREGAWIGAIYAQFVRDLHRNKLVETGNSRAILSATEEKSFREESGTEASREDRQRNSIRATENGRQTESYHNMKTGRWMAVRALLAIPKLEGMTEL